MDPVTLGLVLTGVGVVLGVPAFFVAVKTLRAKGDNGPSPIAAENPVTVEHTVLETVMNNKVLRVGCIAAYPWFIFPEGSKTPTGIYPMILEYIAQKHNLTVEYIPILNAQAIDWLNERRVDLVASLLETPERSRQADFSAFIHNVAVVAVAKKGQNKIRFSGDLKTPEVRAVVVKGEIGAIIAVNFFDMTPDNDRLVELNTRDVPSIFYSLVQTRDQYGCADVAITTGARWIEFQKRDPDAAKQLELAFAKPLRLVPTGALVKSGEGDFCLWLEGEFKSARGDPAIAAAETEFLRGFEDAIDPI